MFLQPFLISFIILNNVFIANLFIVGALVATLGIYFIFNLKAVCKAKVLQNLFMIPCIAVLGFIFVSDLDMKT
jgi:hypothetical protein